jgi:D-methionine transport system permease protein
MLTLIITATFQTLYMSVISTLLASFIGFFLAVILILTSNDGLSPNRYVYATLDVIVNTLRSFPFIILIIVLFPITKFVVGRYTGENAAIVPLTIGTAPFIARLIESAFKEVDRSIIEAARSFGASKVQIVFRVLLPEAFPSIILSITLTLIIVIGFSAMAGAVGAGGLGAVAKQYGYDGFRADILFYTVVILIVMVQCFQSIGNFIYKLIKH